MSAGCGLIVSKAEGGGGGALPAFHKLVFHWASKQQPSLLGSLKVKGDFSDRGSADTLGCYPAPSGLSSSPGRC